jgi:hypothetical protein
VAVAILYMISIRCIKSNTSTALTLVPAYPFSRQ